MAVTKPEILTALGASETVLDAALKVGQAIAMLDAASIDAGGTGYSVIGLAVSIAILGVRSQIDAYLETIAAQRAQAILDNQAAETALQADFERIAQLSALESPTTGDLVEKAGLEAKINRVRSEQAARTQAAETYAQNIMPIVISLQERLRRLATGDLSAV